MHLGPRAMRYYLTSTALLELKAAWLHAEEDGAESVCLT